MPTARGRLRLLLLIGDVYARGGMEVQLASLAKGLVRAGHDVLLVSVRTRGPVADARIASHVDSGVRRIDLGAVSRRQHAFAVRRLARLARQSDLVHCTGWDTTLWGRVAAVLAGRPVVVADHSGSRAYEVSLSGAPRGRWIALHNRLLDRFTGASVICADRQRDLLLSEGVDPKRIVLVPNGVPVAEMRAQARNGLSRAELGIPADARVLAHVASFRSMKRQDLALDITSRLRQALGDVRIVFAGEGPELERVRRLAREREADWAVFLGHQENVAAVFGLADLAILPSASEAMPMAILEAMAMGVPIVATAVGDVALTLERARCGVSVPADDPDAFLAACRHVLTDPATSARLRAAAESARHEVDVDTMVRRYEAVFQRVVEEKRHAASLDSIADRAA